MDCDLLMLAAAARLRLETVKASVVSKLKKNDTHTVQQNNKEQLLCGAVRFTWIEVADASAEALAVFLHKHRFGDKSCMLCICIIFTEIYSSQSRAVSTTALSTSKKD